MSHISKYIDDDGLLYLWGKIKNYVTTALSNSGFYTKPSGGIPSTDLTSAVQTSLGKADTALQSHQDISGKADKATTLAGYGITDAKIASGVITLGTNSITPLTSHQDISGKADRATTLAGYGITDANINNGVITLGSNTITPLTSHQDISGKADLVSPTFTGEPKAPNAAAGTNSTQIATTAFVTTAITNAISGIQGITYSIVTELPSSGSAGIIYLVSNSGSGQNIYDEYIWVNNAFEKIGTTAVDLSGYLQKADYMSNSEMDTATNDWA